MPTTVPDQLALVLRRAGIEAMLALARQQPILSPDAVAALKSELVEVIAAHEDGAGCDRLARLASQLALAEIDLQALVAAVALELEPVFATTITALEGSEPRRGLTSRVFAMIHAAPTGTCSSLQIDANHPLVRSGVFALGGDAALPRTLAPWRVSSRTLSYLCGSDALDPMLARCGAELVPPADADFAHAHAAWALLERALADRVRAVICIEGVDGAGRRSLAAAVAAKLGMCVIALDAGRASLDAATFRAEVRALKHECWLRGAVPLIARIDTLGARAAELHYLLEGEVLDGPKLVTGLPGSALPELDERVVRTRLEVPGPHASVEIWRRALGHEQGLAPALEGAAFAEVVSQYILTPGGIQRAAANARMLARGRPIAESDVRAGVSGEVQERFGELARRVVVTQGWDDLVLPTDTLDDLRALVARAEKTSLVYDQWGFRGKLQRGLGIAALFSGPPGTGKTMVAGLIANSLGRDLYQVDLSQVVSKWIGETEKALGRIFDAAAIGHAVLLFDEADSLFAKRTEVKSSNDRFANLEVNYLLQRIESFGGVAILTTNNDAAIDPAFKRRLAVDIPFFAPDVDERERLWKALLPPTAPRASDLDYSELAGRFDKLCGGNIRNAVLRGAFLAAADGTEISHDHLVRAARAEYRAMGKVGTT